MSQFQPPNQWGNQPPQQPIYPPSPQFYPYQEPPQSPKKRPSSRSFLKMLGSVIAILILFVIIAVAWANNQKSSSTESTIVAPTSPPVEQATVIPTPTPQPTAKPQPTPTPNPHGDIGVMNIVGSWVVTLNKVSPSTGTEFDTPKSGDIYVVVDVTAQNNDSSPQLLADGVMFVFQDQSGQAYDQTFVNIGKPPEGNVPAGTKLRGQLVYEVSKSLHHFTLTFQDRAFASNSASWNITV